MVAIFTGLGAGFERGSGAALGSGGLLGSSALGRGGEGVFVNAANGNLMLTRQDEFLVGLGPDVAVARTYNSLGELYGTLDDNGDLWRQSTDRRVYGLVGTQDTLGSTIKRLSADGSEITYEYGAWEEDVFYYRATDGAGAHDKLVYTAADGADPAYWTWTDGSTQITETYHASETTTDQWRITSQSDPDGNTVDFAYVSATDRLHRVTTHDGSYIEYSWDVANNRIAAIVTGYDDLATPTVETFTPARTHYEYDAADRLIKVSVDFTPHDDDIGDDNVYWTSYTYDGSSQRIASITQKDGSKLEIGYDPTTHRVTSLVQTIADGHTRTTTINYESGYTEITDPRGSIWKLHYETVDADNLNQLIELEGPPPVAGAATISTLFEYDEFGNVERTIDGAGEHTVYTFDAHGNVATITDPNGNATTRVYDERNNLIRETRTGSFDGGASTQLHTRFVYDEKNHLRFVINAEGEVTEHNYNADGLLTRTIVYSAAAHVHALGETTLTLADMTAWRAGPPANSLSSVSTAVFAYDARGNLSDTYRYGAADASDGEGIGEGDTGSGVGDGFSKVHFVYDQHGRLLLKRQGNGQQAETYVYDELGRLILATDLAGGTTTITFTDAESLSADTKTDVVVTLATGFTYTTTSVYNKAGELKSFTDDRASNTLVQRGTETYDYDENGQLRRVIDASGRKSYFIYDRMGRKVADVNQLGDVVSYRYDAAGRVVATVRHANRVSASHLTGSPNSLDLTPTWEVEVTESPQGGATTIRPATHAMDLWTFNIYDDAGRVIETVLGDGSVTTYVYDEAGQLVGTRGYVTKLDSAQVNAFKTTPPLAAVLPAASDDDAVTRTFYDRAGRVIGALNAEGYLSQTVYDEAGRKIQDVAYATVTDSSLRASGTFAELVEGLADPDADISQRWVYDGQGLLRYSVDALNRVTEYVYWDSDDHGLATGLVRKTIVYADALDAPLTSSDYAAARTVIDALSQTGARITYNVYNDRAQLIFAIDAAGGVTGFAYDAGGRVKKTTRFAQTVIMSEEGTMAEWEANLTSWADSNGAGARITRNFYNGRGDLRYVVDAEGYLTQFNHDPEGRLAGERRYAKRLTEIIPVSDATTLLDVFNAPNKGASRDTSYGYDLAGRRVSVTDPSGHFQWFSYNANGTLAWDISGNWADNSRTLVTEYDLAGRKVKEVRYTSELANSSYVGQTALQLNGGQRIQSPDGQYAVVLTNLGELELLHKGERVWATGTREAVAGATYQLRTIDGDLVLWRTVGGVDSVVTVLKESGNSGAAFIKIDNSGKFSFNLGTASTVGAELWSIIGPAAVGSAGTFSETSYAYNGLITTVTDPRGAITTLTHDKLGRLTKKSITPDPTDPETTIITSIEYDAFGRAVATTDGRGHTSYAFYDQAGRVELAIDAEDYATATTYNAFGEVETVTRHYTATQDASLTNKPTPSPHATLDAVTSYAYDNLGRVRLVRDAEGYITRTTYTEFGEVETVKRFANRSATLAEPTPNALLDAETSFAYDLLGRVKQTTDAEGFEEDYTLNAYGERVTVFNKAEGKTVYVYDGRGLVVSETKTIKLIDAPDAPEETVVNLYDYDTRGNLIRKREAWDAAEEKALRTTRYEYDKLDRLVRIFHDTQPDAVAATAISTLSAVTPTEYFYYDKNGNLIEKRDPVGARTLYWYDAANRKTHELSATGTLTRYFYDKSHNVTETRVYKDLEALPPNALGTPPEGSSSPDDFRRTLYVYDENNRLTDVTVPGIATAEMGPTDFAVTTGDPTTHYEYDARGNVVTTTDAAGRTVHAYFDRLNRKIAQIDAGNYRTDWIYNGDGNVLQETRYALTAAAVIGTETPPATQNTSSDDRITQFTYDKMGRRTSEKRLNVTVHTSLNRLSNPGGYPKTAFSSTAAHETGGITGWEFWTDDANGGHVYMTNPDAIPQWLANGDPTTFAIWQSDNQAGSVYHLSQLVDVTAGETYVFSAHTGAHRADVEIFIDWRDASGQHISVSQGPAAQARNNGEASGGQLLSGYKRIWVDGTAPEGATQAYVTVRKYATKAGHADSWMFVTRPQFELSDAATGPTPWADLAVNTVQVDSVIAYEYNELGLVEKKTEASGDSVEYDYDDAGRLRVERRTPFTDFENVSRTPTVEYTYNGLDDLTQTRQLGAGATAERTTLYTYGAGGRLLSMEDPSGFTRTYRYDAAGRVTREEYVRIKPDGSSATEAVGYDYDLAGRVVRQGIVLQGGGAWTRDGANVDTVATLYNAFGEVSKRGFAHYTGGTESVLYGEEFVFNQAGRLERANAGDGVWKYFMYDKAGNQTLMLASVGEDFSEADGDFDTLGEVLALWGGNGSTIATDEKTGIVATITKYDARNQAVLVLEPKRQLNSTTRAGLRTSRAYNAFGEVIRETNALGHDGSNPLASASIEYTYNTMGRLIRTESPAVEGVGENGKWITGYTSEGGAPTATSAIATTFRPVEHRYYDASGRLVAQRDANGYLTRYTLLAGTGYGGSQALIAETFTPDGAVTRTKYDIHGDARRIEDGLYLASAPDMHVTKQTFDEMGRLVQMWRAASATQSLTQYYAYDGLGQRIRHWNSLYGAGAETNVERTFYDHQGRIVQHFAMGGDETANVYAWDPTIAAAGMGTLGGWSQTTTYENDKTVIDKSDVFGRTTSHTNMGGLVGGFTYDMGGRLIQRSGGDAVNYTYFDTGRVATISSATSGTTRTATYGYDQLGAVKSEKLVSGAQQWQNATASYDALGRLVSWDEAGSAYTPAASLDYAYDANGNIRRSNASFKAIDGHGNFAATPTPQDNWYLYDAMNRVVVQKGRLISGQAKVNPGIGGSAFLYDAAGRRVQMTQWFNDQYWVPNDGGEAEGGWWEPFLNERREYYTYDSADRLTKVDAAQDGYEWEEGYIVVESITRGSFEYDPMGRMTRQTDYDGWGLTPGAILYSREMTYNAKGQVIGDEGSTLQGSDVFTSESTYAYGSGTGYALGAPLTIATKNRKNGSDSGAKDTLTTNTYAWGEGAMQSSIAYDSDTGSGSNPINTSTFTYVTVGGQQQMTQAAIVDGRTLAGRMRTEWGSLNVGESLARMGLGPRTVNFRNDLSGQVIRRDEVDSHTTGDPHEVWHRFAGRQVGYVGNNGTSDVHYVASITERVTGTGSGAFRNGSGTSVKYADFDQSIAPINSYFQGSGGGTYTVRAGDTLASIAANLWGDASLWYKIAEVNGLSGQSALIEGQSLILPVGVMKSTHNASTFSPYDPSEALGDVSPTRPKPPKKNKCGVIGQIILVVIAVVVTIYATAYAKEAWGAAIGSFGAGAVGAATGSIVSQGVGVATGIQDEFSWNAVAMAAVSGGVSGGASGGVGGAVAEGISNTFVRAFVAGAINNAISQGVSVAMGWQKKFSWAGVAAAGVSAGVAESVLPSEALSNIGQNQGYLSGAYIAASLQRGTASALASAATRSLIEGSDFGDNIMAALPDVIGQTIGEAIAGGISQASSRRALADYRSRMAQYNAAVDNGATNEELGRLAKELRLNDTPDVAQAYYRGANAPVEVGMLPAVRPANGLGPPGPPPSTGSAPAGPLPELATPEEIRSAQTNVTRVNYRTYRIQPSDTTNPDHRVRIRIGSLNGGDVNEVIHRLEQLPRAVLRYIGRERIRFVATYNSVVEYMPELRNHLTRGSTTRTWDDTSGTYNHLKNAVVFSTHPIGVAALEPSADVLLHELGHGIDWRMRSSNGGTRGSHTHQFGQEYQNANAAGPFQTPAEDYYIKDNTNPSSMAYLEETYAESFAAHFTHNPNNLNPNFLVNRQALSNYWSSMSWPN